MSVWRSARSALDKFGVAMFRRMDAAYTLVWRQFGGGKNRWPVTSGAFVVGDRKAPVAVCTLTSNGLMRPLAALRGVAIAGRLYTCNLGIEKIVLNVCANPRLRVLLVCGKDSPLFQPGQALRSLHTNGIDVAKRIVGACGYLPVLSGLTLEIVERFRQQVVLEDCAGLEKVEAIGARVEGLLGDTRHLRSSRSSLGDFEMAAATHARGVEQRFNVLRPGGKRESMVYDPKGYFVITLDHRVGEVIVHHYLPDATPANEMRGRSGEGILLALIRERLVSQLSHAGYLGAELAKAEAALRLDLEYEQDQPLRPLAS